MANRFARRIKSGEIGSVEELKSEFKSLAKLSHPDLAGEGAAESDFVALRAEYEAALRDFQKHRFGAREGAGAPGASSRAANASTTPEGRVADEAWPCLALLLKRGFPKEPKHEKEALRYEYAKWRLAGALSPGMAAALRDCEAELLSLRSGGGTEALESELRFLRELIDFHDRGLSPMRTEIVLTLGALGANPKVGPAFRSFARALARELGVGIELEG